MERGVTRKTKISTNQSEGGTLKLIALMLLSASRLTLNAIQIALLHTTTPSGSLLQAATASFSTATRNAGGKVSRFLSNSTRSSAPFRALIVAEARMVASTGLRTTKATPSKTARLAANLATI